MHRGGDHWARYVKVIREFDAVLEHAKAVSQSLVGLQPADRFWGYAEQIFVKQLSHCITLRRLAPDPLRRVTSELWDLPSISAVARCAIDAHDAFFYIVADSVMSTVRAFRLDVWKLHDKSRRLHMLTGIGSNNPMVDQVRAEKANLLQSVVNHEEFTKLALGIQKRIREGDPPNFLVGHFARCAEANVNHDYYNAATVQLSQHVHSLPFALHQLFEFRAGEPDAIALMGLPYQFALPFLARVTTRICHEFPERSPVPPSRTRKTMALWQSIASKGLKNDA